MNFCLTGCRLLRRAMMIGGRRLDGPVVALTTQLRRTDRLRLHHCVCSLLSSAAAVATPPPYSAPSWRLESSPTGPWCSSRTTTRSTDSGPTYSHSHNLSYSHRKRRDNYSNWPLKWEKPTGDYYTPSQPSKNRGTLGTCGSLAWRAVVTASTTQTTQPTSPLRRNWHFRGKQRRFGRSRRCR